MTSLPDRLRSHAQNEEMVENAYTEAGRLLNEAAARVEALERLLRLSLHLIEEDHIKGRSLCEEIRATLQPDKGERCGGGAGRRLTGASIHPLPTEPCPGCPDCQEKRCATCGGKRVLPTRSDWPNGRSPCVLPCPDCQEAP